MKSNAAEPEMTKHETFFFCIYIFWLLKDVILKNICRQFSRATLSSKFTAKLRGRFIDFPFCFAGGPVVKNLHAMQETWV